RRAERRALVTADRLVDDQADTLIAGSQYRVQQEAWVAEPDVELHFVRWIDDPRMAAMAEPEAATVPAARVSELPLTSLAAAGEASTAP
ncbi:MAG TPA: hypothetical protein VHE35_37530, partial [Kofleriaceae bacterium]|nr:hypothetical protein [Kofleriaceae bacterium]